MKQISNSLIEKVIYIALVASLTVVSSCTRSTYDKNKAAFEDDRSKFEAMLPQWSKFVEAKKDGFKEVPVQSLSGKIVLLRRDIDFMTKPDEVASLHPRNADFYSADFLASKPEEVGTVVFIHKLTDQSKLYEKNKVYSHDKYQVFLVDAKSGEIRGTKELKVDEKFDPPNLLKNTTVLEPAEKLREFIRSLPFGK